MAPLEPYERVYVNLDFIEEDVHGEISCEVCHKGNPGAEDAKEAHKGIITDPTYPDPSKTCGQCHADITSKNSTNLHATLAPFKRKILRRASKDPKIQDRIEHAMGKNCMTCHSSCGQCHVSRPASVDGGLIDGHMFQKTPPVETNCTSCHGSRIDKEFFGKNPGVPADVHHKKHQMGCKECHSGDEMHGSGKDAFDMFAVENRSRCEDCHKDSAASAQKDDKPNIKTGKPLSNPAHAIHKDKVSCQVCHSVPYKNCFNCHVGENKKGEGYFKVDPSKMGFKIGKNTHPSTDRPEKYVCVRHVPINSGLFDFYVKDALVDIDKFPTWKMTTPHNIQLKTPQNETCLACHDNEEILLTEKDDMEQWEIKANRDVFVSPGPDLYERHGWLPHPRAHLEKV
ncbi:MAG: multiheme c-type cytochrome, partial [Thermodesulfobacteriota bacterium]|nr:multiheme c-type cytochrome [Thermodesulfobacteriota bacterium]